jgi:nucleotide-binding universal stress UspA family protein
MNQLPFETPWVAERKPEFVAPVRKPQKTRGRSRIMEPVRLTHILVPINFSSQSRSTAEYAREFALRLHARIALLHVFEPLADPYESAVTQQMLEREAAAQSACWQQLLLLRDAVTRRSNQPACEPCFRVGRPEVEIVAAAEILQVDLIIISAHDRTGLAPSWVGSTTARVVRHAPCPVLAVRGV